MRIIIVLPCCFKSAGQMCDVSISRAKVAVRLWANDPTQRIICTASVPYRKNGSAIERQTLTQLMEQYLYLNGVSREMFLPNPGGVDTHSESEAMEYFLAEESKITELTIVGSSWYFWGGRLMWRYMLRDFRRRGGRINFVSVPGPVGARIIVFYGGQAVIFYAAWLTGQLDRVGKFLSDRHASRRDGFTMRGCG